MNPLQDFDEVFKLEIEVARAANSATSATSATSALVTQRVSPEEIARIAKVAEVATPLTFEPIEWDSDLIWKSLLRGETVPIYSNVLGELVFWVWSEKEKEGLWKMNPDAMIYSWDEIKALTKAKVTHEGLRKLHEAKRILGGKFAAPRNGGQQ